MNNKGFSLVELSIVLVILGLLTGGILTGQSLIHAAELRAVQTEFSNYSTAINAFKSKYFGLPGDIGNATAFWGDHANCADPTVMDGTPGTCDGNRDGVVEQRAAGSALPAEGYTFWQQLSLGGFIAGSYTGMSGSGSTQDDEISENIPASGYNNGGWNVEDFSSGSTVRFNGNHGKNCFELGANSNSDDTDEPLFTPEDTYYIDMKLDDGQPAQGIVTTRYWSTCTNAADADALDATYDLRNTDIACAIMFCHVF